MEMRSFVGLNPLHTSFITESEELIDADTKVGGQVGQHGNVRHRGSILPFADGLLGDAEMLRHLLLSYALANAQSLNLVSDFHTVFLVSLICCWRAHHSGFWSTKQLRRILRSLTAG